MVTQNVVGYITNYMTTVCCSPLLWGWGGDTSIAYPHGYLLTQAIQKVKGVGRKEKNEGEGNKGEEYSLDRLVVR